MTPDKVRVPSIQCPECAFNNPEGTTACFGCGAELTSTAIHRFITVRRQRQSAEPISLADLQALRARVRVLTEERSTHRTKARTIRRARTQSGRLLPQTGDDRTGAAQKA